MHHHMAEASAAMREKAVLRAIAEKRICSYPKVCRDAPFTELVKQLERIVQSAVHRRGPILRELLQMHVMFKVKVVNQRQQLRVIQKVLCQWQFGFWMVHIEFDNNDIRSGI